MKKDCYTFEGVVKLDPDRLKVYLESNNRITDINFFLTQHIGKKVKIVVCSDFRE